MDGRRSRRDFLRLAALAGAGAALGGCSERGRAKTASAPAASDRTLRIAMWSHFIPRFDAWFDEEYTRGWGERSDVEVVVDHIPYAELGPRAGAEVATGRGHDLFAFITTPAVFEDQVIDHRDIVEEVEAKVGRMAPIVERHVLNPRTGKYFGFGEYWAANPPHYRADMWNEVEPGLTPSTWDDVLRAAPRLKALGRPVGIALSPDDDSCFSLFSLMAAFGADLQDEEGNLTLDRPATVEAVKMGAAIYRAGMSEEVFFWDSSSNNRALATGHSSLVLNAISAIRGAEDQNQEIAASVALAPALAGPAGRLGVSSVVNAFVIWRFARNQEAAKQFLVDLALDAREGLVRSRFYNLPAFPGAVPDLAEIVARDESVQPPTKYALLADAESWSTNPGHPGHANAAVDEVFFQFIVPKMFAAAARGEMSAEDAVKAAAAQAEPIFAKWRERGKI
ncbi:MAG: ABC transporter substrate-binding protein [Acidimicrobiia bacterium]